MLEKEAKSQEKSETREAPDATFPDQGRRAHAVVLHHAAVFVENLDRSASFYADVLGLEVTDRAHLSARGIEQVSLSAGRKHADLVIARRLDGTVASADKRELFHLAFGLARGKPFRAFLDHLVRQGVPVVAGPREHPANFDGSGSRTAVYFRDPDGHLLEVTQEH
jgi:catechol 2,3-dioxygenase-like lactoylglutathione lyase family enzyme